MVSRDWFEMPLPDHRMYPLVTRKLVVDGFGNLPMKEPEDRICVYVKQVLIEKSTNQVYKTIEMPVWIIYEWNQEEVIRPDGSVMTTIIEENDDAGNKIGEQELPKKVPSVQYVKFLVKSKSAHLVDVLERFMIQYVTIFKNEIDLI
ncbi:hypothetical protein [Chryseobacterium sp.]|uniref:hypothetical protein n=1 Tax=Chryseobacterium sp. TaxID=1871047 RepID=UPI00289AC64F|nr:hypothetical protein [Chryseobacterium sp.]